MFELSYPGKCFGNIDISAKECKKCKINQFCTKNSNRVEEICGSGIYHFSNLLFEKFNCKIEEDIGKTNVKCFNKDNNSLFMSVEFNDNGKLIIEKGDVRETVNHIVSKEKADTLFKKLTDIPLCDGIND